MTLAERISGTYEADLLQSEVLLEITRRSQTVRTRQSILSLLLVSVVGAGYMWALWHRTGQSVLILWVVTIVSLTVWRSVISKRVRNNLHSATPATLVKNESDLVPTGIVLPLVIGSGFWLFGCPDDTVTTLAVSLLCCIYAIGSTVNTVAQRRMQGLMVSLNLGQGVLFFLTLGEIAYLAVALQMATLLLLLRNCSPPCHMSIE